MSRKSLGFPMPARALASSAAATCVLLLCGCAVGPNYKTVTPAQILPAHFAPGPAASASAAVAGDWWKGFGDPGLDALVAVALRNNPDLAAAQANIREARAALAEVSGTSAPQLSSVARVGRDQFSRNGENFANIPLAHPKATFGDEHLEFDASWEIDLFGHTARAVEAAKARTQRAQAQRADVELEVGAETARNVLDYRYLMLRIERARADVADREELLRLVRLQREAGMASDIELQQAEIDLHDALAQLPPLQASARACVAALVPLTALTDARITSTLGTLPGRPAIPPARSFRVDSRVLLRRPDVRAAERELAASTAEVGEAMADRYPRFTLVGDAGWDSIDPGRFWQQASHFWNIGPQVYLPVFTGGRVQAQIRGATAARDAARESYRKAVLDALADVESAMLRCKADDGRLRETSAALELQRRQVELAEQRVGAGETSRVELLDAQLQRVALEDQQLANRQTLSDDLVLLYKALGGGQDGP